MAKVIATAAFITLIFGAGILKAHTGHHGGSPNRPKTENNNEALGEHGHSKNRTEQSNANAPLHDHASHASTGDPTEAGIYKNIIKRLGNFHPIAIHFPIALIVMTGIAEILFLLSPSPIYSYSSRFMIIVAAISAIPAVLLGLAFGYEASYSGALEDIFWWHRLGGISTAFLAGITAVIKELHLRKNLKATYWYYGSLIASIAFVLITGYLGGEMTFGLFHMFILKSGA